MAATLLVDPLEIGVAQKTCVAGNVPHLKSCVRIPFSSDGAHGDLILPDIRAARGTIRGNLVSPRPACAPWRDGGKVLSGRPGSSCACEIRASWIACAGWVGMCAWA